MLGIQSLTLCRRTLVVFLLVSCARLSARRQVYSRRRQIPRPRSGCTTKRPIQRGAASGRNENAF